MQLASKLRWRGRLLLDRRALPVRDRLRIALTPGADRRAEALLMPRLRRTDEGDEYFDLNGTRVFFRPTDRPVGDEEALRRGTLLILREAFLDDPGFFCPEVRLRPGDVALDLGGNLGTSALLFARLVGRRGRVISFEPAFADLLERNVRANGLGNVTVVPAAVGDRCGTAEFAVTDFGPDSRIDPGGRGGHRVTVPLVTVDAYCRDEGVDRVDFIKMDIEGGELPALRGAERTIREHRPRLSIASYHSDGGFGGEPQHPKLLRLLKDWGYHVREVEGRHLFGW